MWKNNPVYLTKNGNRKDDEDEKNQETVRSFPRILLMSCDNEGLESVTSAEQKKVEAEVLQLYRLNEEPCLTKKRHIEFLRKSLTNMPEAYECLDCSRPWLCYWNLHALEILGEHLKADEGEKMIKFLSKCQDPQGGFGGGPGQYPHLASTYAAISALCIIGTTGAYEAIDRIGLYKFLHSLKFPDGSFAMHRNGEVDIRGVYCAIAVAKLTNICTPVLFQNTEQWILQCQTWEGGFGGCPGMEAHGGYTYCGLASLVLLGKEHMCHIPSLLRWLVNKQMPVEGGFQGRTNKLVDGCYSFWQGASFPLIHAILSNEDEPLNKNYWLFDQTALQEYLLICCQYVNGGLLDKPAKHRDIYHTCYGLSGLSISQHSPTPLIIGRKNQNTVGTIHPLYNLVFSTATNALNYFNKSLLPD